MTPGTITEPQGSVASQPGLLTEFEAGERITLKKQDGAGEIAQELSMVISCLYK